MFERFKRGNAVRKYVDILPWDERVPVWELIAAKTSSHREKFVFRWIFNLVMYMNVYRNGRTNNLPGASRPTMASKHCVFCHHKSGFRIRSCSTSQSAVSYSLFYLITWLISYTTRLSETCAYHRSLHRCQRDNRSRCIRIVIWRMTMFVLTAYIQFNTRSQLNGRARSVCACLRASWSTTFL
jgi:hypothetical protein